MKDLFHVFTLPDSVRNWLQTNFFPSGLGRCQHCVQFQVSKHLFSDIRWDFIKILLLLFA